VRRARSSREDLVWRGFPRSRTSLVVVRRRLESESATCPVCVYLLSLDSKIELEKKFKSNCVCFSSSSSSFTRLFTRNKYISRREKTRERRVAFSLFASAARLRVYPQERSSLAREKVTMLVRARSNSNWEKKCFRVSFLGRTKLRTTSRAYIGTTTLRKNI
jgi:hypothetical protein